MAWMQLAYWSEALQKHHHANLLVPEKADPPYHVMLLLHGLSDDHTIWMRRTSIERYIEGWPLLLVMPDGGRGFYCDAEQGFAFGKALGHELPDLLERWFPTRTGWAVGGLSMGGYGALRLAFTFPDRFVSAHSHSGALHFGHHPILDPEWAAEFQRIVGANPVGGKDDLFTLAQTVTPRPKVRVDCGTEDFLLEPNRAFTDWMNSLGYEHLYSEHPGEHTWAYWDEHIQPALAFHRENLGF